jgi:GntR family transcriptional regulator/MocR family aminotransferase
VLVPVTAGQDPLNRQVYAGLREAILAGRLKAGARLPSTRTLAHELGVSRNTVLLAFDQLLAEGYVESRRGSGTRVSRRLPDDMVRVPGGPLHVPGPPRSWYGGSRAPETVPGRALSRRGALLSTLPRRVSLMSGPPRAFSLGVPALDALPLEQWSRIQARRWRRAGASLLDYADAAGYAPLRAAIAAHLRAARGVRCDAEQVVVVNGAQQALDLAARVLLDPGDAAWVEDPGYHGARHAFLAAGARLVAVPVDAEGLRVDEGMRRAPDARLVHVTPAHQFPMGAALSLPRRLALIRWARHAGAWIVEDDYDSEFRYASRPLAALQALDDEGRVVYVGTFSKVLFPGLRLGYLVAPPDVVDAVVAARRATDWHGPVLLQAVLTDFLEQGHFDAHVRHMRELYRSRQEALLEAARAELGGLLELPPADAGFHLVGRLPAGVADRKAAERAAAAGVDTVPLSFFATDPLARGGLVLGYAAVDAEAAREGIRALATALR